MSKTHLVWYAICLMLLLSCGSVRHNQMVALERDDYKARLEYQVNKNVILMHLNEALQKRVDECRCDKHQKDW